MNKILLILLIGFLVSCENSDFSYAFEVICLDGIKYYTGTEHRKRNLSVKINDFSLLPEPCLEGIDNEEYRIHP